MNRRKYPNTEVQKSFAEEAIPQVTPEQKAWARVALSRVADSSADLYDAFEALGIAVAK